MKINKNILTELQDVYDYSQLLRSPLAPKGDEAKLVVAQEIHELFSSILGKFSYMKYEDFNQYVFMFVETTEQMLLDMLNNEFTVKEMELYD